MSRDYSSISPTARALLLMKGMTPTVAYARQAGEIVWANTAIDFEARYLSVDEVLNSLGEMPNYLELASGFSFRSLATTLRHSCTYLDTDLEEVIVAKQPLAARLME